MAAATTAGAASPLDRDITPRAAAQSTTADPASPPSPVGSAQTVRELPRADAVLRPPAREREAAAAHTTTTIEAVSPSGAEANEVAAPASRSSTADAQDGPSARDAHQPPASPAVQRSGADDSRDGAYADPGPVRRVALRPRPRRAGRGREAAPVAPVLVAALAPTSAATAPAADAPAAVPPPDATVLPAPLDAPTSARNGLAAVPAPRTAARPALPRPGSRPEPTRAATLAAFRNALPPEAAPLAPSPFAAPAIAPVLAVARWPAPRPMTRPTLSRVQTDPPSQPAQSASEPQAPAKAEPPDLDALADHVLERLRHELRDGRERLGYLLDDLR